MGDNLSPLLGVNWLPPAEHPQMVGHGSLIRITHRFWVPDTLCREGEEVLNIDLYGPSGGVALPLSTRLRVMVDYLARYRHIGQTASQIAAGLNCHPFFRRHGANGGRPTAKKKVTRAAVKQQISRLRRVLSAGTERTGIAESANPILKSESTDSNEVLYRLKSSVIWRHIEF